MASLAALTGLMVIFAPVVVGALPVTGIVCPDNAAVYQGWRIRRLEVYSPFAFIPAVKSILSDVTATLPLQQKNPFDATSYSAGTAFITAAIKAKFPLKSTMLQLVVVTDRLLDCDKTARSLDVQYLVFTAFIPSRGGQMFESQQEAAEKPATAGDKTASEGKLLAIPNFAYDQTRHGFGGMQITFPAALGIFDELKVDSSASTNSLLGNIGLGGRRMLRSEFFHSVEWKLSANYSDIPTDTQHLKEAKLAGSFFGSTAPLGSSGVVLNYAAALAGGHQQTSLSATPNTSYGDLKFLMDVQANRGASTFSGAYGIQLGSALGERSVDFVKHVVDLRHSFLYSPMPKYKPCRAGQPCLCRAGDTCDDRSRFIGATHRPFSLETRLGAGVIQRLGIVPSAERFFGGNQQNTPFIEGEPWDISGQPYIRSIPEYQIGSTNPASFGLGGTRFYALNLTASKAVAGRAILPRELGETHDSKDGGFVQVLDGSIETATGKIADMYFAKDPAILKLAEQFKELGVAVAKLQLPDPGKFDAASKRLLTPVIGGLKLKMKLAAINVANVLASTGNPQNLFQLIPQFDADLAKMQNVLAANHQDSFLEPLKAGQSAIDSAFMALEAAWNSGPPGSNRSPIQEAHSRASARAQADLAPARKVLNTVLYQLNLYSVAPVGIFDVARVWPSGVGTRYAVGGGVRLSLVNTNFTLGYAFNPQRMPRERVGALFFQLDITNLFQ